MFLLLGVHLLKLLGVLALRLLNLMEGPQFLVLHYTLDYRLDREEFFSDALVEIFTEPSATCRIFPVFREWPELSDEKIFVVHEFFIRGPQRSSFTLLASLHWSLLVDFEEVDLLHGWKIYHAIIADHNPAILLLFSTLEPLVVSVLKGHRFVIRVELPVRIAFLPRIRPRVIEPPKSFKGEIIWLSGFIF